MIIAASLTIPGIPPEDQAGYRANWYFWQHRVKSVYSYAVTFQG